MADVLHIDDPKVVTLAQELAKRTGESVSDAVLHALEHEIALTPPKREKASMEELLAIIEKIRSLPVLDTRGADELVGCDEDGLPA